MPRKKSKPIKIPPVVATPFPPLNLKKTGNKCPNKTDIIEPATIMTPASGETSSIKKFFNIKITIHPLIASPIKVSKAATLSPVLNTLVAPGLFEPYALGSSKPRNLLIKIANETEPIKYESKQTKKKM